MNESKKPFRRSKKQTKKRPRQVRNHWSMPEHCKGKNLRVRCKD